MPWLTIIMALVTFFLSGGAKKENRGRAALAALAVGAGTYYVTHHTDWGAENLGFIDGVSVSPGPDGTNVTTGPADPVSTVPTGRAPGQTNSGFWSSLGGWLTSPVGQIVSGGAAVGAVSGISKIPVWAIVGGGAALIFLLKD